MRPHLHPMVVVRLNRSKLTPANLTRFFPSQHKDEPQKDMKFVGRNRKSIRMVHLQVIHTLSIRAVNTPTTGIEQRVHPRPIFFYHLMRNLNQCRAVLRSLDPARRRRPNRQINTYPETTNVALSLPQYNRARISQVILKSPSL